MHFSGGHSGGHGGGGYGHSPSGHSHVYHDHGHAGGHGDGISIGQMLGLTHGHSGGIFGFLSHMLGQHHVTHHHHMSGGGEPDQSPNWNMAMQAESNPFARFLKTRIRFTPALGFFLLFIGLTFWLGVVYSLRHSDQVVSKQMYGQPLPANQTAQAPAVETSNAMASATPYAQQPAFSSANVPSYRGPSFNMTAGNTQQTVLPQSSMGSQQQSYIPATQPGIVAQQYAPPVQSFAMPQPYALSSPSSPGTVTGGYMVEPRGYIPIERLRLVVNH